ncbi:MAG: hypothetical protein A2734_02820 [Parcubacteria group bacterium RIFCSPHIGHO2_01_FULL_40_30]|nr:MAG: hypothetical protein A2734_02820 [Parcubacteria group bacterium RIFCSPHIGHO2_01_FULL_40_30]OHB23582.1 MAG: hypothetical protein A3I22_02960 [Parcubacteria group bacterium RIFCSPLOWO2_02_FULL_40_12]
MSDKWEDEGVVPNIEHDILDMVLPEDMQTNTHRVRNTETGEKRLVRVDPGQSVGEAIAEGQWED